MNSSDKPETKQTMIISDDEFVALMELKYQNSEEHVNDIDRRKVWNKLKGPIEGLAEKDAGQTTIQVPRQATAISSKWNSYSQTIAVVLLFFGILPAVFFINPQDDSAVNPAFNGAPAIGKAKGMSRVFNSAELHVYRLDSSGQIQSLTTQTVTDQKHETEDIALVNIGDTILFKVTVKQSSAVALAFSQNSTLPKILYRHEIMPPAVEQLLQNGEQAFGYRVEAEDKFVRFCAITADSPLLLNKRALVLQQEWTNLPTGSCVVIQQASIP